MKPMDCTTSARWRAGASRGFTLIELVITVMIIGILAAIAIPQYQQYVTKARRTEAKSALARVQGAQERYFTVNNTYTQDPLQLQLLSCAANTTTSGDTCASGNYTITIGALGGAIATGYTLTATPVHADSLCGAYAIDSLNTRTVTGTSTVANCW